MKYLRAVELHEEHSRPCPHCGAPEGHWCISGSGHVNTKSHRARMPKQERPALPDLREWWREQGRIEKEARKHEKTDRSAGNIAYSSARARR